MNTLAVQRPAEGFRHEALLYAGPDEFLEGTLSFIREALAAEEPLLVVVSAAKIDLLRAELHCDAAGVQFADMDQVGSNPARIIPAWREFARERSGAARRLWGIGEPIWPGRSPAQLVECHRHESLLNLAFAEAPAFRLLCPYDTERLDPAVVEEACRNHPVVVARGARQESATYAGLEAVAAPFREPLPEPRAEAHELCFKAGALESLRSSVSRIGADAGMSAARRGDLLLAVHEVATNSVRHGGGEGTARLWREEDALICEIRDAGSIDDPLAGRERPQRDYGGGYGLWMVNQLCDLVQIRSFPSGSVVRLHVRLE